MVVERTIEQVARRIVRDLNKSADFAGQTQQVYDRRTGERVGFFAGSPVYVEQWSLWNGETMVWFAGGNGRRASYPEILSALTRRGELFGRLLDQDDEDDEYYVED